MAQQRRNRGKRDRNDFTDLRVGLYCRVSKADPNDPEAERQKSTEDQQAIGEEWVREHGAELVKVYSDDGISASRFTRKAREHYDALISDVRDGKLDVIWCWEQSRLSRRPGEFHTLLDLCRDNGVMWVIQNTAYDPNDYKAMLAPSMLSVIDAVSSEQTSERVRRGLESNAHAGRPHSRSLYGYRRLYDRETRRLIRVEPDVFDGDGSAVENSPAAIVREVFERIAAGDSIRSIRLDLDARRVPTPRGGAQWSHLTLREMALNPAYVGKRVHQGEVLDDVTAVWPPLVGDELFWTVRRILTSSERTKTRPARAKSLLTHIAGCAECGAKLYRNSRSHNGKRKHVYTCRSRACVGVDAAELDQLVERVIVRWLSDPGVFAALTEVDDSATAAQARADADRARVELAEWRDAAEAGDITAAGFARAEKGLLARIAEAEQRARESTVPPVLAGRIGPEAEAAWDRAPLEVRRQMIAAVANIRIRAVGRSQVRVQDRIEWRWLLGPNAGQPILPPERPVSLSDAQLLLTLARNDSVLQKDLPTLLGRTAANTWRAIRKATDRGWVDRTRMRTGNRGAETYALALTEEGRAAVAGFVGDSGLIA